MKIRQNISTPKIAISVPIIAPVKFIQTSLKAKNLPGVIDWKISVTDAIIKSMPGDKRDENFQLVRRKIEPQMPKPSIKYSPKCPIIFLTLDDAEPSIA